MKFGILSQYPKVYSTNTLVQACLKNKIAFEILDYNKTDMSFENGVPVVYYLGNKISAKGNAIAKKSIVTNLKDLMGRIFSMAVTAGKAVAGIPIVGPILAAAAIGAAVAGGMMLYNKVKGDDVMSSPGKRTLFAGKDQISLNSDDTVVAGTDLFGKKKSNRSEGPDNSALVAAIDRLTSVVTTGGVVNIDGQKVAVIMSNLLALTSYKTQ